jgi:hypothetical protein
LAGKNFANVVFKEYVFAWGLAKADSHLTEALRIEMVNRESPFLPSQLLSRFMSAMAPGEAILLDGRDFGVLYESLLSQVGASERQLSLTVIQSGEDTILGTVTLARNVGEEVGDEVEMEVLDGGAGIHFWRHLTNADVDVTAQVRLGLEGQRFALGPRVSLSCGRFETLCEHVEVDATDGVRIEAASYGTALPTLRVTVRNTDRGEVAIHWPNVSHPWASYRAQKAVAPTILSETDEGDVLRKLVLMFRRQRTRRRSTVAGARWSPEQLTARDALLDLALRRGVLREISSIDSLEFNNDFASLKSLVEDEVKLSERAREFVEEYLGVNQTARIVAKR